jgi:hypothetical protein
MDEGLDEASRRLLFWFRIPYVADVALGIIGVALLLADRASGWWVLVFAAVRAIIGTFALYWLAPRMLAQRRPGGDGQDDER